MSIQGRRNVVFVVWAAVGVMLVWRGLPYTGFREVVDVTALQGDSRWIALAAAVVVGIGKGLTALKKGARRAVTHIESQGPEAPMWSVFSPVMILLVAIMVGAGLALRYAPYDADVKAWIVGILYPAIGLALVIGGLLARTVPPLEARTAS
jgi:hypothetical protein